MTADEVVDLLAGRTRAKVHLSPELAARAGRLLGRQMHPATLEILATDSLADAPGAIEELGTTLTPLRKGLATD
jgi:hypothetical protein